MLADEKIIACEGSRFLTIRIEANEPFPNFGSTEQEKAILAHAVYVYAWLDPATGAREKICTRPYATAISTTITTAGSTTPAISAMPTPPASRPPCCTLTLPTAPRKRCSRPSRLHTYGIDVCAPFSPAFAGVPQRHLCVLNAGDANADCLLDMETGDVAPGPHGHGGGRAPPRAAAGLHRVGPMADNRQPPRRL